MDAGAHPGRRESSPEGQLPGRYWRRSLGDAERAHRIEKGAERSGVWMAHGVPGQTRERPRKQSRFCVVHRLDRKVAPLWEGETERDVLTEQRQVLVAQRVHHAVGDLSSRCTYD